MTPPLRPVLIRTLIRLDALLQRVEHPANLVLYEGLGLASSRAHLMLGELRALGLVDRTRSPGHIWITDAGRAVLEDHRQGRERAQRLRDDVLAFRNRGEARTF